MLSSVDDGLESGSAKTIDGEGADVLWDTGFKTDVSGEVDSVTRAGDNVS